MNGNAKPEAARASRTSSERRSVRISIWVTRSSPSPGTVATKNEKNVTISSTPVVTRNATGLEMVARDAVIDDAPAGPDELEGDLDFSMM